MKYKTLIVLFGVFISSAAMAAPLWPILPQFKGMTIQNQCGKHGAQSGTKFCAGVPGRTAPTPERGGFTSAGAIYLYFYDKSCLTDVVEGYKMAPIDMHFAIENCKDIEKHYRWRAAKPGR